MLQSDNTTFFFFVLQKADTFLLTCATGKLQNRVCIRNTVATLVTGSWPPSESQGTDSQKAFIVLLEVVVQAT